MTREERFSFKVLIKKELDAWVAHCLELNLVAEADTSEQVTSEIIDVIVAHVRYAIENDNVAYMYHAAPPEVWRDFFKCENREEASHRMAETIGADSLSMIPIIQTSNCFYGQECHA
jgi:hypothetical protein